MQSEIRWNNLQVIYIHRLRQLFHLVSLFHLTTQVWVVYPFYMGNEVIPNSIRLTPHDAGVVAPPWEMDIERKNIRYWKKSAKLLH